MYTLSPKCENLEPYVTVPGEYRIRLDANESFLLPTERDRELMAQAAAEVVLNRYPDPMSSDLCAAFAARYGVDPALVTAGCGSDDLISVITRVFLQKGERMMVLDRDFSMYRFYAALDERECIVCPKREDLTVDVQAVVDTINAQGVRLFIFSNPCNPTSLGIDRTAVRRILNETQALIVLDEAYMDFWDQSLLGEVCDYDNLIILRTASKAVGLAALRLGFAVANERLTGLLRAAKSPYNVSAASQAMGAVVLRNPIYGEVYTDMLIAARNLLMEGLRPLHERGLIRLYDSCTNFVFFEVDNAPVIYEDLRDRGILIRCMGERHLRVTAGKEIHCKETLANLRWLIAHEGGCHDGHD